MKSKVRKCLSGIMAAAVAFTSAAMPIPSSVEKVSAADKAGHLTLAARYPLQADASDISGAGKDAEIHGTVTWTDGLTLPGKKKTSAPDASYVELPSDIFQGSEELTISAWINSNTDKGNYSALFFGTPQQSNNMPLNYWLFNPTNPSGLFKSVFTNSDNSGAPYNSEVGVTGGNTTGYKGEWTHYTTVLTENSVTGYINGEKVGTAEKTKTIASFGDIQAYIGRSNYLEDTTYAGSFQDLTVYQGAADEEEVGEIFEDTSQVNDSIRKKIFPKKMEKFTIDDVVGNGLIVKAQKLALPKKYEGADIAWTSSEPSVIAADGTVVLPQEKKDVTLTAELSMGSLKTKKEFVLTVLPEGKAASYMAENLFIPYVLHGNMTLPTGTDGMTITWSGEGAVKADGTITPEFDGWKQVKLTAEISADGKKENKSFTCQILGKDSVYAESYTRLPDSTYGNSIARSMFLAYSENGKDAFEALHDDSGVLFMRAEDNENETLTRKSMRDPYLFYTDDLKFGVAAVRTEVDGSEDQTQKSGIVLYTSEDLLDYQEIGYVDLKTDKSVLNPVCEYDGQAKLYRVTWNDGEGGYYQNTLSALQRDAEVSDPVKVQSPYTVSNSTGLKNVVEGNLLALDSAKGKRLHQKLSKIVNTKMTLSADKVQAKTIDDLKDVYATAAYNDGSTAVKRIKWDYKTVDFEKPGTYTITGKASQPSFPESSPLFTGNADPNMAYFNGKFYYISTNENGQADFYLRESDSLDKIGSASQSKILEKNSYPEMFNSCFWAPELHVIGKDLYIFFAGSLSGWSGVQSYVMKLKTGGDPKKMADWEKPVRVVDKDGNNLYETEKGITLDMTYFEVGGKSYVVWAQRQLQPVDTGSWLYIAQVDAKEPWKLISDKTVISKPDYGWDNNETFVDEGPFAIVRNGKVFLTLSGAATNNTYCVGMLSADDSADLLKAESWKKKNYPILTSFSVQGQYGPGHNSYVEDTDGTLYNVFHAKWNGGARSASIRRVHFDAEGEPVLDVVPERDISEECASVSMQVEVLAGGKNPDSVPDTIAEFDFEKVPENGSFEGGYAAAKVNGTCELTERGENDHALYLTAGNYLSITRKDGSGLFNDVTEGTISFDFKEESSDTNWPFYASAISGAQNANNEKYLGVLLKSGKLTVERYNNSGQRPDNPAASIDTNWNHVDIVLTDAKTTIYLNGKKAAEQSSSYDLPGILGTDGLVYLGKANWGSGEFFTGWLDNFKVTTTAKAESELTGDAYADEILKKEKEGLTLPQALKANLTLPPKGNYGAQLSWSVKSGQEYIAIDGNTAKVTRPALGKAEGKAVLTAEISILGKKETKDISVTILPQEALNVQTSIVIPAYVTGDLPSKIGDSEIKWECDNKNLIREDGTVTLPKKGEGSKKVTLKVLSGGKEIASGTAEVLEYGGSILTYVAKGGDLLAYKDSRRSDALYVAKKDGDTYKELNKGKAIMYVAWDGDQKKQENNQMGSPKFFRMADGTLALAASGNNAKDGIYLWTMTDGANLTDQSWLQLNADGIGVADPCIWYDSAAKCYKIFWKGSDGSNYVTISKTLKEKVSELETTIGQFPLPAISGTLPEAAATAEAGEFVMSPAEYEAFTRKYDALHNTSVDAVTISAKPGDKVTLPETVTARYNDGSSKKLGVDWSAEDLAKLADLKEGSTYTVKGTVKQDAFAYPFIAERADPHVFYNEDDGYFYSTGSYYEENMKSNNRAQSYRKLDIRRAKTLEGLKTAEEHYLMETKIGDRWGSFIWAPEYHKINGKWYCLVGAHDFGSAGVKSNTDDGWCSQSLLIPYEGTKEDIQAGGMLEADQWGEPIVLNLPSQASAAFDVSYYEDAQGQGYYIIPHSAQLWIVKVKKGEGVVPQPEGNPVCLKGLKWPWEYGIFEGSVSTSNPEGDDQGIVEGPYLFEYGDKVYISYSGATVDKYYCLGLLMADKSSNIMDPKSWTEIPYPLLSSYDTYKGQIGGGAHVGGGHNSIVLDEYGNLALIYHARPYPDPHEGQAGAGGLFDPCRHTVVKSINVAYDGTLVFNMTAEEELDPAYRTVTAVITVPKKDNGTNGTNGTNGAANTSGNKAAANPVTKATVKKVNYEVSGNTAIVKSVSSRNASSVTIKSSVTIGGKSYKVTKISDGAFQKCKKLKKVTIESGITRIGKNAFKNCKKLKTIIIKGNITKIGKNAFKGVGKKALFKIKANKKKYKKIVKLIKKSGAKKPRFKRVK